MSGSQVTPSMRTSILLGGRGVAGSVDGRGEPASTWREAMRTGQVVPSGSGAGFRERPDAILDAVLSLPVDEVLLRVEWARLAPAEGSLDDAEVAWITELLSTVRAAGRRTGVVLTDGAVPAWLGPEAWLQPAMPNRLAALAVDLVAALDGCVDVLVPLEEPGAWCVAGWMAGAAPPLRRGAVNDAVAALDSMLAGHLLSADALADVAPNVETVWLASSGVAQVAERAFLGLPLASGPIERAVLALVGRSPGRTATLRGHGSLRGGQVVLPFGADAPTPLGAVTSALWAVGNARSVVAPSAAAALGEAPPGPVGLRMVHSAATIDERGRVSRLRGHRRLELLERALDEVTDRGDVNRVILGEATDRWRWGSFRSREGIFGVDRTRGAVGYELLEVDAAGIDAGRGLAALLSGRTT